jgi:hypothetical protein
MPFGIVDTAYIDLPAVIDQTYVAGLTTGSGLDFADVLREADSRMAAFNASGDPLVAALARTTDEAFVEYSVPVALDVQRTSEYTMSRMQHAEEMGGHMLPVAGWDVSVGWTEDGLREQRLSSVMNQLDGVLNGIRLRFRREVMRRFFSDAEIRVDRKTTATSPGFAGSGTGLNVYTRPYPNGTALPGGYTHYVRTDAAGLSAALLAARDKLLKQGHQAPFDLIAPQTQIDAIAADTANFVKAGSPLVRLGPTESEALVESSIYVGVFGYMIRVRQAIDDFSDANIGVFKTYGPLSDLNPLAVRYPVTPGLPGDGRSAYIRSRQLFPLAHAEVISRWGVGVNDRVSAVLLRVAASGNYIAPVIP